MRQAFFYICSKVCIFEYQKYVSMKNLQQVFSDFVGLFYPDLCAACSKRKPIKKHVVCIHCLLDLAQTNGHLKKENLFTQRFWGQIPLETGAALFYFVKGGRTQQLIHNLKYNNRSDIGIRIGQWYGHLLAESPFYQDIDYIVPVPLHPRKQHQRGYNQSDAFAEGLSESMQVPWRAGALQRILYSASQTRKSKEERLSNVLQSFEVAQPHLLENKRILLVDDVLTTGATLEACALKILDIPKTTIRMATIAMAKN